MNHLRRVFRELPAELRAERRAYLAVLHGVYDGHLTIWGAVRRKSGKLAMRWQVSMTHLRRLERFRMYLMNY